MNLSKLLRSLSITINNSKYQNLDVKGIAFNSSKVKRGFLFIAISGNHSDGHRFINEAKKNGAIAIIGEQVLESLDVPYFHVPNSRKALALLAKTFYGNPTNNKIIIGITGTNGKTTTSYMLKHILETQRISCSLFGSISTIINGIENPSSHTTLDALTYHQLLSKSYDQVVIMEVSSHGLIQHRVEGIKFDYCIFTNLEHEHLDYHRDMDSYFIAKQSLFTHMKSNGIAIVHSSSEWGERLCTFVNSIEKQLIKINGINPTYTINDEEIFRNPIVGTEGHLLRTCMNGKHNIENAALAYSAAVSLELSPQKVVDALKDFNGIPGRYELIPHPTGATSIVDYAHTENAFYHILETVKSHEPRKIIHVFGFRGNRDVQKRKKMLNLSLKYCDHCILTFDDLNGVSSAQMIEDLESFGHHEKCVIIPDRTEAIKYAWEMAKNRDWVVITGKGNELYQQRYSIPTFSDSQTLQYLLDIGQKHSTLIN